MTRAKSGSARDLQFSERLVKLRRFLRQAGDSALLVSNKANIRYLSGFQGFSCLLLITPKRQLLFSDFRYRLQAMEEAPHFHFQEVERNIFLALPEHLRRLNLAQIAFEANSLTVAQFKALRGKTSQIKWKATEEIIEGLRTIKEPAEIEEITKAAEITDKAFLHMLSVLAPGKTEREIALEGVGCMMRAGAKEAAFDFIVASGPRAALPHAGNSGRSLRKGDLVIFDIGARLQSGYCSDLTRTVAVGRAYAWQREIYALVYEAQARALALLRPGAIAGEVDAAARQFIAQHGYGANFGHSLGHGVGLEVHEAPWLAKGRKNVLAEGMALTVEPGIYLPGKGGVRIEDLIVVTRKGHKIISSAPKPMELMVV